MGLPELVGWSKGAAAGEVRPTVSVEGALGGDTAILVVSSQWGNLKARPPAGWDVLVNENFNGRSGYVAWRTLEAPGDAVDVNPWADSQDQARDRALLFVFRGEVEPATGGWGTDPNPDGPYGLIVGAVNGAKENPAPAVNVDGKSMPYVAGESSAVRSWTTMVAALGFSAPDIRVPEGGAWPNGWLFVQLAPGLRSRVQVDGAECGVSCFQGVGGEVPAEMGVMPDGARSVDELLARPGFVVAHRGGSGTWREHTAEAFTQSVAHGADALEISCQKTTDGVWVAVHDRRLTDNLDKDAPNTPITDMSSEEVWKWEPRAIRLEWLLEHYADSHVLFVDPKYSAALWREFLPFFKPERTVFKFSADATWLSDAVRGAGFKCWGYAYSQHALDGNLANWAPHWDYLGMEDGANDEAWAKTMEVAAGKPVIAHIIRSRQSFDAQVARGAAGCMVASVGAVLPDSV